MTHATGTTTEMERLKSGFADPVFDSQAAFRAVLNAMSYAGRVHELETDLDPPRPLNALFRTLFGLERHLVGRVPLPAGVSLFALLAPR